MEVTIAYDEVTNLVGVNIPMTKKEHPNFESICLLRHHFKRELQRLPCPQSTLLGWKGLVMAQELYALPNLMPFRTTNNPGPNAIYIRALDPEKLNAQPDPAPLTRTEQATIDTSFACPKHYFLSMRNIERACFTALDSTIDDAFKVCCRLIILRTPDKVRRDMDDQARPLSQV
jgi:hypothetical protein